MKLKYSDILLLKRGIELIDRGYSAVVGDKAIQRSFKLEGPVRLALARLAVALKPHLEVVEKLNKDLFEATEPEELTNEKAETVRKVPSEKSAQYNRDLEALMATPIDLKLGKFKIRLGDLKLAENAIPSQAVADLTPVIVDDSPAETDEKADD